MKLSPILKPQKFQDFSVCDIETFNWVKFLAIGYCNKDEYHVFLTLKKFLDFLRTAPDLPETVFAHFGGIFDFMFIIEAMIKDPYWTVGAIVPRGSGILYFTASCKGREYTFRDSSALLPFGLKSITENFGVKSIKKDWDHKLTKNTPHQKQNGITLLDYLKTDCLGLYESIEKFYQWPLIQKSGPAVTVAGQAMRVFRTFLKEDIWGLSKEGEKFCRQAYLGGRTEIFRPLCEKGPLYEYDVNSLYPSVMRDNLFPVGTGFFTYDFDDKLQGIYQATAIAPNNIHVPCLGVVSDGKFIFPIGRFDGHWTSAEINYAISLGYEIEIKKGYVFPESRRLFAEFIEALYAIRGMSPKNSVNDIIAKLLMNSSYGRFGMDLEKSNIDFEMSEGADEYKTIEINGKHIPLYITPTHLKTFTHPAIAAFVTSFARIHMHRLFGSLGSHLFYTDTDSIFTTRPLSHGKGLGELKLENTFDTAVFLLPKTYLAEGLLKRKIAMKGFDKKKIAQFSMEDFRHALEGDLKRFRIENAPKFATLKTAIGMKKLVTMTKASAKQLAAVYSKRLVYEKAGEFFSTPLTLGGSQCNSPKKQSRKKQSPASLSKRVLKSSS